MQIFILKIQFPLIFALLCLLSSVALCAEVLPAAPDVLTIGSVGMVPAEPFAACIGGGATRNLLTHEMTISANGHTVTIMAGRDSLGVDGHLQPLPTTPFEHNDLLYTPLRALVTALGGDLAIDSASYSVTVHLPGMPAPLRLTKWPIALRLVDGIPLKPSQYLLNLDGSGLTRLSCWLSPDHAVIDTDLITNEFPVLSPDGTTLLYSRDGTLYRRALTNPREEVLLAADDAAGLLYSAPRYNRDGTAILCILRRQHDEDNAYVAVLNAHSGAMTMLKPGWDPCFTPDGAQIALVQRDDPYLRQAVYLVNLDGSGMRKITAGFAPRFSPDGTALLCSRWYSIDDQGQPGACGLVIHLLSGADAGSEFAMTADQQTTREYNGTFTPDGQQLLFDETMLVHNGARLMEGPGKGIFLMDRNRRNVLRLLNDGATQPTMTPDGADVFYLQENTLYYWVRKTGDTHRLTSGLNIQHYTFTPDGKHIILLAW